MRQRTAAKLDIGDRVILRGDPNGTEYVIEGIVHGESVTLKSIESFRLRGLPEPIPYTQVQQAE